MLGNVCILEGGEDGEYGMVIPIISKWVVFFFTSNVLFMCFVDWIGVDCDDARMV